MKKLFAAILVAGMLVFAGSAMAVPIYFEDYTNLGGVRVYSSQSYSWTHDTPTDLAVPPDTVFWAYLTVYARYINGSGAFVTLETDIQGQYVGGSWYWGWEAFDIGKVFTDGWTSADSPLNVTLTSGYSSLWLDGSKFSILYENGCEPPAGVPEPATMLLLGFGLAGVAYARKRFKK